MEKSKKYSLHISKVDDLWQAQITRQVTSKKQHVSKQKSDFTSEAQAQEWGQKELAEFSSTLNASNQRHTKQRNNNMEARRQRSTRRADKTAQAKLALANESSDAETDPSLDD